MTVCEFCNEDVSNVGYHLADVHRLVAVQHTLTAKYYVPVATAAEMIEAKKEAVPTKTKLPPRSKE